MATYYSTRGSITAGALVQPRTPVDITSFTDSITVSVALVTADTIILGKLPANSTVQEIILTNTASLGATANIIVGDAGVTNRYITTTALTAAAVTRLNNPVGHGYTNTADTSLLLTASSIATGTTGTVVKVTVIYTMNS